MTNLVVDRDNLIKIVQDWLKVTGVEKETQVEITFSEDEVIIRPHSMKMVELDAWLDEATRKYDSVLKRLAIS